MASRPAVARRPRRAAPSAQEIAALRERVAVFERQFASDSAAMFDADPPGAATVEETDDLHAWHTAWCRLRFLTES